MGEGYNQPRSVLDGRLLRRHKQYFWANGRLKFDCWNSNVNAATTDTDWEIHKYTSDGEEDEAYHFGAVNSEAVINVLPWNI